MMKEVSNEKISNLRDIILDRADSEKKINMAQGRREADDWLAHETEKLQRETNLILQDARKRKIAAAVRYSPRSVKNRRRPCVCRTGYFQTLWDAFRISWCTLETAQTIPTS